MWFSQDLGLPRYPRVFRQQMYIKDIAVYCSSMLAGAAKLGKCQHQLLEPQRPVLSIAFEHIGLAMSNACWSLEAQI